MANLGEFKQFALGLLNPLLDPNLANANNNAEIEDEGNAGNWEAGDAGKREHLHYNVVQFLIDGINAIGPNGIPPASLLGDINDTIEQLNNNSPHAIEYNQRYFKQAFGEEAGVAEHGKYLNALYNIKQQLQQHVGGRRRKSRKGRRSSFKSRRSARRSITRKFKNRK
jgi:hypothetical protein